MRRRSADGGGAAAWYARAGKFSDQRRFDDAAECYRRALELDAGHIDAQFNLATTLIALGRAGQAEPLLRKMIADGHASADVLQNLGVAFAAQQRHAEAEECFRRALSGRAPSAAILRDLALALEHQSRHAEAIECMHRALEVSPADAQLHCDTANMHYQHGALDRARAHLVAALELAPAHREAAARLGCLDLLDGRILAGWAGYRLLMRDALVAQNADTALDLALPADLSGKTVLLLGEQGIGDELTFLRFAPLLKARGARIAYRSESALGAVLAARTTCVDAVYALADPLPRRDCTLLAGDLPALLAIDTVPPPLPLAPLPSRAPAMRERLAACGPPPYISVAWRAGLSAVTPAGSPSALTKEIPLPALAPGLRGLQATLIALQRHPHAGEIEGFARLIGCPLHDLSQANGDLEDMLALLTLLDDHIAVSNTNMHLLASLGGRARVLVPCPPDWRWMASGNHSPWFPGFTVYRQNDDSGWTAAVAQLQQDVGNAGPRRGMA